jgi:hypothetical protein
MFTPLLILIIATPLLLLAIASFCFIRWKTNYYYEQAVYEENRYTWHYHGCEHEINHLSEKEQEKVKKSYDKYGKYNELYEKTFYLFVVLIVVLSFTIFIFGLISTIGLLNANYEVREYSAMYDMITETLENSNDLSTVGVASKVMEYNEWLAGARFSQEYWGNWSPYFYQDLSNLQYIIP